MALLDPPQQLQHYGRSQRGNWRRADLREDILVVDVQDVGRMHRDPARHLRGVPLPYYRLERRCMLEMPNRSGLLAVDARIGPGLQKACRRIAVLAGQREAEFGIAAQHEQLFPPRDSVFSTPGAKASRRHEHVKPAGIGQFVALVRCLGLPAT